MTTEQLKFQSTLPLRGATRVNKVNHNATVFQSTLPLRGATSTPDIVRIAYPFQSTLPLRGATRRRSTSWRVR